MTLNSLNYHAWILSSSLDLFYQILEIFVKFEKNLVVIFSNVFLSASFSETPVMCMLGQ